MKPKSIDHHERVVLPPLEDFTFTDILGGFAEGTRPLPRRPLRRQRRHATAWGTCMGGESGWPRLQRFDLDS
jgi:hypothetical protein